MSVIEEKVQNEVWINSTPGTVFIKRMNHRGEMARDEQIDAGRRFNITTEERRLNMEQVAHPIQDPFRNGTFQPVRLLSDDEEARELANNPNAMAESDMKAMLKGAAKAFDEKLAQITNLSTLDRLLKLAYAEDAPVSRVERIKAHSESVGRSVGAVRAVEAPDPSKPGATSRPVFGRPVSPG